MKINILLFIFLLTGFTVAAQAKENTSSTTEQQLENLAELTEADPTDDSYVQQQEHFKKHPLNINTASADELAELNMLTALQVQQLLLYRNQLGKLINLYELQAIPGWDIATIKKVLPYIDVSDEKSFAEHLSERWKGGDGLFITRYARVLEKSKGYGKPLDSSANHYLGSPGKIFMRYTYNYKNLLRWGLLGDKDAGEQFFRGHQRQGFDFYSFHFFARQMGIIKALAIGDFTVNFGQGLTQWQSMAFKKSTDVLAVKRQAATLRPYSSAGEYNFHRGTGITLQKRNWETTVFVSFKKISANTDADTAAGDDPVSSFLAGGYHRTAAENENRNNLRQLAFGGNLQTRNNNWHLGVSAVHYHFSKPVQKSDEPYNLFALQGKSLTNASVDYSYTWRNIHFFGEAAADSKFNKAFVNGAVISLDTKVDAAFVYRKIDRAYQSVNANAFTENSFPVNENGFYAGVSVRPVAAIKINAYADVFQFPWLKYRVDAPSSGKDFLVQLTYTPDKRTEIYARYKNESKMINRSGTDLTTKLVDLVPKKDFRMQVSTTVKSELVLKSRIELMWYNNSYAADAGQGFLGYIDGNYKPSFKKWAGSLRLQYFETDGYNARIYAYESDMPYNFSIPFYYGKGFRYYFNFNWDATKLINKKKAKKPQLDLWLRWAQTIYSNQTSIGSGLDEINGNHRSEIKFEIILAR